jgi:Golgi phosphoprotein 3 GPP34
MLLAEQLLLFQFDPDRDTPVAAYNGRRRRSPQDDLAGAIFLELALRGRLAMDADEQLVVANGTSLNDSILEQALTTFAGAPPTSNNQQWFDNIHPGDLQHLVADRMAQQGLPHGDGRRHKQQELTQAIRSVVFESSTLDQRMAALIVLLDVCWLMTGDIIGGKEEKAYRKRFDQLFPDYLEWLADYETDMGTVLVEGVARPSSNAMSAILIALGNQFRV